MYLTQTECILFQ